MEANPDGHLHLPLPSTHSLHDHPIVDTDFTGFSIFSFSSQTLQNLLRSRTDQIKKVIPFASKSISSTPQPSSETRAWPRLASRSSTHPQALMKKLSVFERAAIGAASGGLAGAFSYLCLHPIDTIKTKLQTRGASKVYKNSADVILTILKEKGALGFYTGLSAAVLGSTASSAVYFGTCEFGKSILSKTGKYPSMLIPPTAGAMGNIVSSAIMIPKELITQRMQAGARGKAWEVLWKILEKDGVLGLYAGYSATLLRNLPAGVLSYSSFEYMKAAVLIGTRKSHLDPFQSVCCGAVAGAISACMTTPLDVVKTRLMTQVNREMADKIAAATHSGVSVAAKQIWREEGWVGFTRGMGPRVIHSASFSALGYLAFETTRLCLASQYLKVKEMRELVDAAPP